jgi:Ca-activated chloride channel family protein
MKNRHVRRTVTWICAGALAVACGKRDAPTSQEAARDEKETSTVAGRPAEPAPPPPAVTTTPGDTTTKKNADPHAGAPAMALEQGQMGAIGHGSGTGMGYGVGGGGATRGRAGGPMAPAKRPAPDMGGDDGRGSEDYAHYDVNKMTLSSEDHLSTFAVDVDTASYSIARRKILAGQKVPADAVRVEEFVNYFKYGYQGPGDGRPFAVHMEAAPSPYGSGRHLLRVAVQGKQVSKRERKKAHLVFLVDVSGSMSSSDKLPLAQRSLRILVDNLNEGDTVALVTYAGSTRVVLPPTGMDKKAEIYAAIDELSAGGSTAMGSGLELAYGIAVKQVAPDAETRVIVLSDGDANVGHTTHEQILKTIQGHVKEGVTLSTIGFGMGNYKDTMMEQLANKGNGNNYYIDSLSQAKRVFQEQLGGTLEVIAQDVKIQVDFNPKAVKAYRLVGYENRDIADQDFRNDKVDAGEIGAGHAVTALYEVELAEKAEPTLATVRIRAKKPRGTEAAEYAYAFDASKLRTSFADASADFRWVAAVAGFAEILRKSPYADGWKIDTVLTIARGAAGSGNEEREEFINLVTRAKDVG